MVGKSTPDAEKIIASFNTGLSKLKEDEIWDRVIQKLDFGKK